MLNRLFQYIQIQMRFRKTPYTIRQIPSQKSCQKFKRDLRGLLAFFDSIRFYIGILLRIELKRTSLSVCQIFYQEFCLLLKRNNPWTPIAFRVVIITRIAFVTHDHLNFVQTSDNTPCRCTRFHCIFFRVRFGLVKIQNSNPDKKCCQ